MSHVQINESNLAARMWQGFGKDHYPLQVTPIRKWHSCQSQNIFCVSVSTFNFVGETMHYLLDSYNGLRKTASLRRILWAGNLKRVYISLKQGFLRMNGFLNNVLLQCICLRPSFTHLWFQASKEIGFFVLGLSSRVHFSGVNCLFILGVTLMCFNV